MSLPNEKNPAFSSFPNEFASSEEKASDVYGIQYARPMWGGYLKNGQTMMAQKQRDIINRRYAPGS